CLVCGSKTEKNGIFCSECANFALIVERKCRKCGAFTLDPSKPDCMSCRGKKIFFDTIFSCYIYSGPVSSVISKMKYGKIESYAAVLGTFLAMNVPADMVKGRTVIFPPMSFLHKFIRSFNQAQIIADRVASHHKLELDANMIKKVKKTKPQASLTYEERQTNLKNAFALTKNVENRSFLIVDDVCTTFSTINTIAELLKKNGAESVNAVTVARTTPLFT
ncbi:MAG TPA: phosphoribosyltransferase family protein, partial [bacterium]|nr:phosphoribosyltransferase family protein [bacterium]